MFRLAQISDPHLGPLPSVAWTDLVSKRAFGWYNWRRNRARAFAPAVLDALTSDMLARKPDHIAVTGDLVNLGLPDEFDNARAWLDNLGEPKDVTVIPGNHDAYVHGAVEEFTDAWHPYMLGDEAREVHFPFIRKRGNVAIVALSSAVPTAPLMATGEIGGGQAAALASRLAALGRSALFRVVLIHHPPVVKSSRWHKRLVDGDLFRQAIAESGAELILHGHNHKTSVAHLPGPNGPVPVIGVAAAAQLPHDGKPGGSYLMFSIEEAGAGFTVAMTERGVVTPGGAVETISERSLTG
jgi:3',5'-cyclic AMP phosphodiesterase CpdA